MQFSTMTDGPGGGKGSRPYFVRKATGLEDVKVISTLFSSVILGRGEGMGLSLWKSLNQISLRVDCAARRNMPFFNNTVNNTTWVLGYPSSSQPPDHGSGTSDYLCRREALLRLLFNGGA